MLAAIAVLALPLLSGCGPKRMKTDFTGFESAFAETSNREVLLNLVRLQNHNPTYFFKLGQITSSYRMQASLSGTGNYVTQGTGTAGNAIGGGTPGLLYENDPVFTFIPVNDETNAQLLLNPIPAETFYILYQQGWRVDQLMRLMIDRIEVPWPRDGHCIYETIRNVPPAATSRSTPPDPDSVSDYVTFLRVSAVAYELQKHGYLRLQGTSKFVPFDLNSALDATTPPSPKPVKPPAPDDRNTEASDQGSEPPRTGSSAPNASDIAKAAASNTSWELIGGKWILGQQVTVPVFVLNPPPELNPPATPSVTSSAYDQAVADAIETELQTSNELQELKEGTALKQTLATLSHGFSIETAQTPQAPSTQSTQNPANAQPCGPPHLLMRSILGIMSAAAEEQAAFDALMKDPSPIKRSRWVPPDSLPQLPFAQAVPRIEQLPILRTTWTSADKGTAPLVQVDYRGKQYFIADSENPSIPPVDEYWNRDMFRLISQLQSQVTVDISKFPLPAVLQLNTQ